MRIGTIENEIEVAAGNVLRLDSGRTEVLYACEDWDAAKLRFPNPIPAWHYSHAIACNVDVTGKAIVKYNGDYWVRVRVTWVGDCEPDTYGKGWLRTDWSGKPIWFRPEKRNY